MNVLPDNVLRAMSAEDRKKLGRAGITKAEAQEIFERGEEKKLKRLAMNELHRRGCWIFEQAMNKRTRGRAGVPDLIGCFRGHFFAVELKADGATLSEKQAYEARCIRNAGGRYIVAYDLKQIQLMLAGIIADDA